MGFATGKTYKSDGELRMDFPGGWEGDKVDLFTEEGRASATVTVGGKRSRRDNWLSFTTMQEPSSSGGKPRM